MVGQVRPRVLSQRANLDFALKSSLGNFYEGRSDLQGRRGGLLRARRALVAMDRS